MSRRASADQSRSIAILLLLCVFVPAACALPPTPLPTRAAPPAPTTERRPPVAEIPVPSAPLPPAPCLARGPFPPLLAGLRYGINAFLLGEGQARALDLTRHAGFGWLRQQIHWRDIEIAPGRYDWTPLDLAVDAARRAGSQILLSVVRSPRWATAGGAGGLPDDPAMLGVFLRALAERYAGRVAAYEIWNEPNLAIENGGRAAAPAEYLAVLRAAYPAVKQADPCALVLAAPLAATATDDPAIAADDLRFYRELYALDGGAFLRAADLLALHPGGGDQAFDARWPEDAPDRSRAYFRHVEAIRALMLQAGDPRQVWITEVGWTTRAVAGAPPPVNPQQQAGNLVGALRLTREAYPWVSGIFVWNLNFGVLGPAGDEKSAFGILNPDWTPRPAYLALQEELATQAAREASTLPRFSADAPYRPGWQFGVEGKSHTAPTIAGDGTIYTGSDPGYLYALAPGGGLRWMFKSPGEIRSAPAIRPDGTLYQADANGTLTALQPDGHTIWQHTLPGAIRGSPLLARDGLYVVTADGTALRLDPGGKIIWQVALRAAPAPALLDGVTLYIPTGAGEVWALALDGTLRWRVTIGPRITAAPAIMDDPGGRRLLVGDADGYLTSLDATSGQVIWRRKLVERIESPSLPAGSALIAAPPLVDGEGTIYLGGRDGVLTALDRQGTPRWRYVTGSDISATPARASDGSILIGLYDERLLAVGPDGALRWQVRLRGAVRSTPAFGSDGTLYVATVGGMLYALAPNSGFGEQK